MARSPPRPRPPRQSPGAPSRRYCCAALCCLLLLSRSCCRAQTLGSLISLSRALGADGTRTTAAGYGVNVVDAGDDGGTFPLCYLPFVFAFSRPESDEPRNSLGGYEGVAALSLALEHLNTGNGEIVPELEGLDGRCPLKFFPDSFDTVAQRSYALNHVIALTDAYELNAESYTDASNLIGVDVDQSADDPPGIRPDPLGAVARRLQRPDEKPLAPLAILGAGGSPNTIATSTITSSRGVPQVSTRATSKALDDKAQFPLFGRTIPNDDGTAAAAVAKLKDWNVRYLAVLHTNDAYGNAFADGIRQEALTEGLMVTNVNLDPEPDDASISNAIKQLVGTKYTYFFGVISSGKILFKVMEKAHSEGIAGTGLHNWLFSDSVGRSVTHKPFGSRPLEKAFRGTGILAASGAEGGLEAHGKLAASLKRLRTSDEDMEFLNGRFPRDFPAERGPTNHSEVTGSESFLQSPGFVAPFLYDAAVGLGLAACGLASEASSRTSEGYFTGKELYRAWANTTFQGTSGLVDIDRSTGTRKPSSSFFSLKNFVVDQDASPEGQVKFKGVNTGYYHMGEWTTTEAYTFNDGTHDVPRDLPVAVEQKVDLGTVNKVVGLILCCIVVVLAITAGVWTFVNRKQRVVRASQPIFLYIIAAGTMLMGVSIIPLTIGPNLPGACMAFPWLLVIGFSLVFSALFTKTWRIKTIMNSAAKFKRIKLSAIDVMKPMIAILFLDIIVLAVWSAVDPLTSLTMVDGRDEFARVLKSHDTCSGRNSVTYTVILGVINLGSVTVALIQAHQARNISTEFSESTYILDVMKIMLYASFLGIPVLIITRGRSTNDAFYFVWAALIFIICSSIFLLIFRPKVVATRASEPGSEQSESKQWGLTVSERVGMNKEESDGIQIYSTRGKEALEKDLQQLEREKCKFKQLCMTLSGNHGHDYDASTLYSFIERTYHTTEEDGMGQLLEFAQKMV